jgi:hypothetical protein
MDSQMKYYHPKESREKARCRPSCWIMNWFDDQSNCEYWNFDLVSRS